MPQPCQLLLLPHVRNGEQAALSCLLAQQRSHAGPEAFDWGTVSAKPYIRVVNRLIPEVDTDLDALDDEEQMSASKERRNLTDVFLEKRRGVSSLKLRTLLKVNVLHTCGVDFQATFSGASGACDIRLARQIRSADTGCVYVVCVDDIRYRVLFFDLHGTTATDCGSHHSVRNPANRRVPE